MFLRIIALNFRIIPHDFIILNISKEHILSFVKNIAVSTNTNSGQSIVTSGHNSSNIALIQSLNCPFGRCLQLIFHY